MQASPPPAPPAAAPAVRSATRIPRIVHLCFGMAPDFGGKPWSLVHHVCAASAVAVLRPERAHLYYAFEPTGPWWEATRRLLDPVRIEAPTQIFGNPLLHPAHQADVVRLEKLLAHGGIYLDCDVLVRRDFGPLLGHSAVLGQEGEGGREGLCNAVILAEPEAPFLRRWHASYASFRARGKDEFWCEHSVQVPSRLAAEHPGELAIVDHRAFFSPLWTKPELDRLFASRRPLDNPDAYAHHLWESQAWEDYLGELTVRRVRRVETNFHRMARPYLEGLPDDYGAPPRARRLASWVRRRWRVATKHVPRRLEDAARRRARALLRR